MPERVRHDEEPITFALHIKTEYTVWMANEHVDVIIVGAGLSGIGAARHLQTECPDRSYRVLDSRSASGGTWDLFRSPGIRSDSDMYTLGYDFKPSTEAKASANGTSTINHNRKTDRR